MATAVAALLEAASRAAASGRIEAALEELERAEALCVVSPAGLEKQMAAVYAAKGALLADRLGRHREALPCFLAVLEYNACFYGTASAQSAQSAACIATTMGNLGDYAGALTNFQRACTILEELGMRDSILYAQLQRNMGSALCSQGHVAEGLLHYETCLATRLVCLPANHPLIADAWEAVCVANVALGRFPAAAEARAASNAVGTARGGETAPATQSGGVRGAAAATTASTSAGKAVISGAPYTSTSLADEGSGEGRLLCTQDVEGPPACAAESPQLTPALSPLILSDSSLVTAHASTPSLVPVDSGPPAASLHVASVTATVAASGLSTFGCDIDVDE